MDSSSTSNTSVEFGGIVRIVKETTKLYKHYYNNTIGVSETERYSHGKETYYKNAGLEDLLSQETTSFWCVLGQCSAQD